MNNHLINQITIDCLLNKAIMGNYIMKQREKQLVKEDLELYENRIMDLFHQLISSKYPENMSPDVKYSFDMFVKSSIDFFKTEDLHKDLVLDEDEDEDEDADEDADLDLDLDEANKLLMRSVKMDVQINTLDKYVKKKKPLPVIDFPKCRKLDISATELNYEESKKNIDNLYEDSSQKNA